MHDRSHHPGRHGVRGRHGVSDEERGGPQLIEVDVELEADLSRAGASDDLAETVDYGRVFAPAAKSSRSRASTCSKPSPKPSRREVLADFQPVRGRHRRVRKPGVPIDGVLEYARRARSSAGAPNSVWLTEPAGLTPSVSGTWSVWPSRRHGQRDRVARLVLAQDLVDRGGARRCACR